MMWYDTADPPPIPLAAARSSSLAMRKFFAAAMFATGIPLSPANADCGAEIMAAHGAMQQAVPYRSEMLSQSTFGTIKTVSEVDLPRALRTRIEGPDPSHTLVVGERAWRDSGQGLVELPADQAKAVGEHVRRTMSRPAAMPEKPRCRPAELHDGRSFKVYEYEQTFKMGDQPGISAARMLVDTATGLPARMEVNSTALGMVSVMLITLTYDKSIVIAPP